MAYPIERLIGTLKATEAERADLLQLLLNEGIDEAIDAAFINEKMAKAILGDEYPRLSPVLKAATDSARPMMDAWALIGSGGGGGGTVAEEKSDQKSPSTEPGPPPGRVPHVTDVGDPSGAPEGTRGTNAAVVRSPRLLRSFTINTLRKGANKKGAPPPEA